MIVPKQAVELLPCPFCGSTEVSSSIGETGDGKPWRYIECEGCGANTEPDVWNKRAPALMGVQQTADVERVLALFEQLTDSRCVELQLAISAKQAERTVSELKDDAQIAVDFLDKIISYPPADLYMRGLALKARAALSPAPASPQPQEVEPVRERDTPVARPIGQERSR